MTPLLALSLFLYLGSLPQTPTVSLSQDGANLKVSWTGPEIRPQHWIGIVPADRPDSFTDIPSTRYQYLIPDAPAILTFPNPGPGEWEARYFISNSGPVAARSEKLTIGMVEPTPLPTVQQTRRVIQVVITRANGTVETRPAEESTHLANPAQAALELVVPGLMDGDIAEVKEWVEIITVPTRTPDRIWRVRVNKAIP